MTTSVKILSDIAIFTKYAKYLPEKKRRETYAELVTRNKAMHLESYPDLTEEIEEAYQFVYDKKILPSMRSMQFAGKPITISPSRIFNCAFLPIDDWRAFSEVMFLLLGGSGVGFSVQKQHVEKLPIVQQPTGNNRRYLIGDSIEGWADSVKVLMKSYFGILNSKPIFDYSDIRAKGEALITSGGKAPGPEPLRKCLTIIEGILREKESGTNLTTIEVHDIVCHIADAVLAGGIRRAALISLFSFDDEDMRSCKVGQWWEENPQRGRANNSAVILRHKIEEQDFFALWKKIELSGSGEPGISWSNNSDWGYNPCHEVALRPFGFCNLTEINASDVQSQEDLNARAKAASFIGTLQAGYTDFHYLRDVWKRTAEKDALIGVSMTGIASGAVLECDLREASQVVVDENKRVADLIGIAPAARCTTIKPAGTTSLVLGSSSGIHGWHAPYYLRRMRVGKTEAIYKYLATNHPELVKDEVFRPREQAVIEVPQKAPHQAIFRDETALSTLERVKKFSREWVDPGHRTGQNKHNVSCTVSIKDHEWEMIGQWMWINRDFYNGIAVLPYDGGTYAQAPFEDISEEQFLALEEALSDIDLTKVIEDDDETDLSGELACAGGVCEL